MRLWAALMMLAGCGGPGPHRNPPAVDAAPAPQPTGAHHHYVVNRLLIPTTAEQATEYGLAIDGGAVKNAFGAGTAALASAGFDVQGVMDRAIADGSIILLLDLQADDLTSSVGLAGLHIFKGTSPLPSPCAGSADTVCGHHLDGTGSFATPQPGVPAAPYDVLEGGVVEGVFSGSGDYGPPPIEIALVGNVPLDVPLRRMQVRASGLTPTSIADATIAGVLEAPSWNDGFGGGVVGALAAEMQTLVSLDCTMLASPPGCGCTAGSLGEQILGYFDTNPRDCRASLAEISATSFANLPDDTSWANGVGVSFGVKITAVAALYDDPEPAP